MKHTLLTGLLLASLSVLVLHAADAPKAAPNRSAELFPDFNWDPVPVNIHFGKRGQMTDAELDFIASQSEFVALEKSHGVDVHGSTVLPKRRISSSGATPASKCCSTSRKTHENGTIRFQLGDADDPRRSFSCCLCGSLWHRRADMRG
jgi:hypothetical protein